MDTALKIRRVDGEAEADAIGKMQAICFPVDTPVAPSVGDWWLAYDEDEPVAFGCLVRSASWVDCGYLSRAGVMPEYRGRGLQKRLIRVRCARAAKIGWPWVVTDTNNPASANSLIACGFKLYAPVKPWGLKSSIYLRRRVCTNHL